VRSLSRKGVDFVLDGLGGAMSVRSFRALRPGGRLVVFGYSSALTQGRRSRQAWLKWNAQTASVFLLGVLSPRRRVHGYRIDKLRNRHPEWFREDFLPSSSCFAAATSTRSCPSAFRSPKYAERTSCSRAPRRRESSYSCQKALRTLADDARRPCVLERVHADFMTISLAKEGVAFAPARATSMACL
jgi:hypothetical protein